MGIAGCGNQCIKFTIFGINILLSLLGLALLGVGVWAYTDKNARNIIHWNFNFTSTDVSSNTINGDTFTAAMIGLMVLGGLIFLVSFFGCCGAMMENRVLLGIYFVFVFILFIIQLVFAIMSIVVVQNGEFKDKLGNMTAKLNATDLEHVQSALKCCGAGWDGKPSAGVTCTQDELNSKLGCAQVIYDLLRVSALALAIIAFVAIAVELIAMSCSCCLMCAIGKEY